MTAPDPREAIGARREQVAAFDRPERLNTAFDIREAVAGVRETADLWKVYRPEWLTVYTSEHPGLAGKEQAALFFGHQYAERVREEDVRYEPTSTVHPDRYPWRLQLRLPNVKGEHKRRELAEQQAQDSGWDDAVIVARNSREEFALKDYSRKKLPRSERG